MKNLLLLLATLGVFSSVLGQAPTPSPRLVTTVPQLTDSIQRIMRQEHIPGLLLTLVAHDSVLFEGGLGLADVENHRPVTAHTLFRMGSITKTFVATGLLQLVAQGKLSLHDEVRKLAPEIRIDNPWEATDPVRVVHVLEHTAGFDDISFNHFYNSTATDPRGVAAVQVFSRELHCRWRPGERMAYSNPGYQLAGYLLEKRSGQPYEQYLSQHLFRPLGMPDATADLRPATNPLLARGYRYDGDDDHYRRLPATPIYAGPAGSLSASAADMTRWVQFFLHDFRAADGTALLPPAALGEMETVHSSLGFQGGLTAGYGLANMPMNWLGNAMFRGHSGSIDGFSSYFGYQRSLGVGYALSNNGDQRMASIHKLVQRFLLRRAPTPPRPQLVALHTAAVAPYLGHYHNAAPRNHLLGLGDYLLGDQHLTQRGQMLVLEPLIGEPDTLMPTGPLTFRHPREQFTTMLLTHDHDGHPTLVTAKDYFQAASSGWWWLRPALLALSLLLVLTACLAGLVWLVQALRRRLPRAQVLPRLLPLLATLALLAGVAAFASLISNLWESGHFNLTTGLVGLAPLAFAVFSLAGLLLTLRRFRQFRSRVVAWYLLLTYGALGWLAATLASYGWLSLQYWSI